MNTEKNLNNLVIEIEAKLQQNTLNKEHLIVEGFLLWYVLVEDIYCENFSENQIKGLLKKNYQNYQNKYSYDTDYTFIIGWMINIAFWYFDPISDEQFGLKLMTKAYKSNPRNSLFKWAIRQDLNLSNANLIELRNDIHSNFDLLYNHGFLIKEYFTELTSPTSAGF